MPLIIKQLEKFNVVSTEDKRAISVKRFDSNITLLVNYSYWFELLRTYSKHFPCIIQETSPIVLQSDPKIPFLFLFHSIVMITFHAIFIVFYCSLSKRNAPAGNLQWRLTAILDLFFHWRKFSPSRDSFYLIKRCLLWPYVSRLTSFSKKMSLVSFRFVLFLSFLPFLRFYA